jgi:hypothetical protein
MSSPSPTRWASCPPCWRALTLTSADVGQPGCQEVRDAVVEIRTAIAGRHGGHAASTVGASPARCA